MLKKKMILRVTTDSFDLDTQERAMAPNTINPSNKTTPQTNKQPIAPNIGSKQINNPLSPISANYFPETVGFIFNPGVPRLSKTTQPDPKIKRRFPKIPPDSF